MHVQRLLVRRAAGTEQRIDQPGKAVRFADDDVGVFALLRVRELARQQLRRTANAAERILDFVRELANHLPPGAVLNQQRIFARDLVAPRHICHFDQQRRAVAVDRRHPAVDDALLECTSFGPEPQFVGVVIAAAHDAAQDIAQFRFVVDQPQQRRAARPLRADAEDVFCGRIQADDQQVGVEQDDARAQAVENFLCVAVERAVVTGAVGARSRA